jgi:hypothetical protein
MLTVSQTVKFTNIVELGDDLHRFIVIELRDDRVLVELVCDWNIKPQSVYLVSDLMPA